MSGDVAPVAGETVERPYCLRCEAPIYQDEQGVWRREAAGVDACPRNPAQDGHEPAPAEATGLREAVEAILAESYTGLVTVADLRAVLAEATDGVTSVEPGCACGGMAACPQCQERDALAVEAAGRDEVCVVCGEDADEGPVASNGDHWCGECYRDGEPATAGMDVDL